MTANKKMNDEADLSMNVMILKVQRTAQFFLVLKNIFFFENYNFIIKERKS